MYNQASYDTIPPGMCFPQEIQNEASGRSQVISCILSG